MLAHLGGYLPILQAGYSFVGRCPAVIRVQAGTVSLQGVFDRHDSGSIPGGIRQAGQIDELRGMHGEPLAEFIKLLFNGAVQERSELIGSLGKQVPIGVQRECCDVVCIHMLRVLALAI